MKVRILTPQWSKDIESQAVFFPGSVCPFEVLHDHAPMISTLDEGLIRWRTANGEESLAIKGGVVRIGRNEMTVCVEEK